MKETPSGTPVGVDDPYEHVERCDHVTGDGRCRLAFERPEKDPEFARQRRSESFSCPVVEGDWEWKDCPHFRSREHERKCLRCGLEEKPTFGERPLLEEHHLSYPEGETDHEITVPLCRWCHAKIHRSGARIDDEVEPDPRAIAEREKRTESERKEFDFSTGAERYDS